MTKKKLIDDQDKFFDWLGKCPYIFKYRYNKDASITLTFNEVDPYWNDDYELEKKEREYVSSCIRN